MCELIYVSFTYFKKIHDMSSIIFKDIINNPVSHDITHSFCLTEMLFLCPTSSQTPRLLVTDHHSLCSASVSPASSDSSVRVPGTCISVPVHYP